MGDELHQWVKFSLADCIAALQVKYGSLGALAVRYWENVVHPACVAKKLISSSAGSNYAANHTFQDRSRLAICLFFDGVVTSRNALGRAAVRSRKFHVVSFRVANVEAICRDSDCILPLAIVPPAAWQRYGFDGVMSALLPDFEAMFSGARYMFASILLSMVLCIVMFKSFSYNMLLLTCI